MYAASGFLILCRWPFCALANLYKKLFIKLVSIKELYYDARPTKSQDINYNSLWGAGGRYSVWEEEVQLQNDTTDVQVQSSCNKVTKYPVEIPTRCSFVIEFIIPSLLKAQHVSSGTPLIIRSSKLYLQPLVYIPMWWPAVALATAGHHMGI